MSPVPAITASLLERRSKRPAARGFTLVEAMVVIAIAAIFAAVGIPTFRSYIGTMNSKAAAFDLISDLGLARAEAIARNRRAWVEPLVVGDWSQGWRVIVEPPPDEADQTPIERRRHDRLSSSLVVKAGKANPGAVQFEPNGRIGSATDDATFGWTVSALRKDGSVDTEITQRCVVITPTGSARSKTGACS